MAENNSNPLPATTRMLRARQRRQWARRTRYLNGSFPSRRDRSVQVHTRQPDLANDDIPVHSLARSGINEPFPKLKRLNHENEGVKCPICQETYKMTGAHRPAALGCGHLFGAICITSWLLEQTHSASCPICGKKASIQDLRFICPTRVVTVDGSEIAVMQQRLEKAQAERDAMVRTHNAVTS